jgi:omega-6 fatty acid desaturase (delta-12 desaturase)
MSREPSGNAAGSRAAAAPIQRTSASVWQIANTFPPLLILFYAMYRALPVSYALVLALAIIAAGFVVRVFIIQHDCGHGSFFRSTKANDRMGWICSVFTLVPYLYWKRQHQLHHATSGNLDKRGSGDMDLCTVSEYLKLSPRERFRYRAYRNPLVFLLIGPLVMYLWTNRLVFDRTQTTRRQRRSVYVTNLMTITLVIAAGLTVGFGKALMILGPVLYIAGGAGIWLFYIQHQFEHTYWKRGVEWNLRFAALKGSSFYRLPAVLRWFTGNIGFHHIHHLDESTPNYGLPQVYAEHPELQDVYTVTLLSSLKTAFLSVWDEEQERLISFRELKRTGRLFRSGEGAARNLTVS